MPNIIVGDVMAVCEENVEAISKVQCFVFMCHVIVRHGIYWDVQYRRSLK